MYSKIPSIIINFIFGVFLWHDVWGFICLLFFIRKPAISYFVFIVVYGIVIVFFCVWYNRNRYRKVINAEISCSKKEFYLTLFLPLSAFTGFVFFFVH